MQRKAFVAYVAIPLSGFVGYFAGLRFLPAFTMRVLHTEQGAIEWGTAVAFLLASVGALRLFRKTRGIVPARYRATYGLFAAIALFVAFEEVSYGQKLFRWKSPDWFSRNNSKGETNLHNMFDNKPSNRMRAIATVGCPVVCLVLPFIAQARNRFQAGAWAHYLLPRLELATMSALTLLLTLFNKIPAIKGMASWSGHLGECKELVWGVVAVCYARILYKRLHEPHASASLTGPAASSRSLCRSRRAA